MTTKTITLRAIDLLPDIATRDDVPVNWLSTLSTRIKAEIPDGEEAGAVIRGLGACTVSWPHTLSEVEQLQDTIAEMQAAAAQMKALLPIEGGVSPAVADKLRELLK